MDIQINQKNCRFNARSSCIIKDKNQQVVLSRMRGIESHETFILPGGRLELLESSNDSIKREIKEELGLDINSYKLIAIEENMNEKINFHMIEFVFYAEAESLNNITSDGWDKFIIAKIKNIDNYDIRPKSMTKLIKQTTYDVIEHHVNRDWGNQ